MADRERFRCPNCDTPTAVQVDGGLAGRFIGHQDDAARGTRNCPGSWTLPLERDPDSRYYAQACS